MTFFGGDEKRRTVDRPVIIVMTGISWLFVERVLTFPANTKSGHKKENSKANLVAFMLNHTVNVKTHWVEESFRTF